MICQKYRRDLILRIERAAELIRTNTIILMQEKGGTGWVLLDTETTHRLPDYIFANGILMRGCVHHRQPLARKNIVKMCAQSMALVLTSTYSANFIRVWRLGHQAAAAGLRALEFERDGGLSAVQRPGYQGIVR
jgi:hypothetical protein